MNDREIKYPDGRIEHPHVHFEPTDVRFGCILALIAAGCFVFAAQYFLIWKFYGWQRSVQQAAKQSPYSPAPPTAAQLPPEPRLEQIDRMTAEQSADIHKKLATKERTLQSFGPTAEKGFVHIPIAEAMKNIAGQLPVMKQPIDQHADNAGLIDSGESNSGRLFRGGQP